MKTHCCSAPAPASAASWRLWSALLIGLLLPAAHAAPLLIGGTGSGSVLMQRLAQEFQSAHPDAQIQVVMPPLSSGGGVRALAAGRLDLAVVGRPLNAEESALGNLGQTIEFVRTPLALASSTAKTTNLSRKELADIYAGRNTRWRDGSPIRLILRSREESDTAMLRRLSPEMSAAIDASFSRAGLPIADNDVDAIDLVAKTPDSLGPVALGLARLDGRPLRLIALDGVEPETKNLANSKYPALKAIYLVLGANPSAAARQFLAFVHGDRARRVLLDAGFLPQSQWPPVPANR
jgi:phosphate transport system substrate-binding protein